LNPRRWLAWFWAAVVTVVVIHNGYLWWQQRLVPDTNILALLPARGADQCCSGAGANGRGGATARDRAD
jgi:hypothetical protein